MISESLTTFRTYFDHSVTESEPRLIYDLCHESNESNISLDFLMATRGPIIFVFFLACHQIRDVHSTTTSNMMAEDGVNSQQHIRGDQIYTYNPLSFVHMQ